MFLIIPRGRLSKAYHHLDVLCQRHLPMLLVSLKDAQSPDDHSMVSYALPS